MRLLCLWTIACLYGLQTAAQSGKYISLLIPDSLKNNADAVIREQSTVFRVKDIATASLQVHKVVTVMNSDGNQHLVFAESSDKFNILDEAEVIVYNALGVKLNTYSKKEMHNTAFGSGLVEDGKTTWFEVTAGSYPITIETNYTVRYKGTLFYPEYDIQYPYQSVQQSEYRVEVPASLGMHYRCMNKAPQPERSQQGEMVVYSWKLNNLPACTMEKHGGSFRNYLPYILLAPDRFQMDDYAGDMTSWKQFGQWYASLVGNTNVLGESRRAFFNNLVKDATTDRQKAALIYRYLQQNMRYVSVQLGIGGWKPFAATFVDEKKYGDCKALSNYMQAALSAVGVKSYGAIIYWDDALSKRMSRPLAEDFPVSRFNHVVVCVPQPKDSIWLECTSTTADFGELGSGKQNRKALLITENGGVLVSTPQGRPQENTRGAHTDIELTEEGTGKVTALMTATGDFREEQLYHLAQASSDEKNRYLINEVGWKHPDELQIHTGSKNDRVFTIEAAMQYEKIPSFKTGNKMFLPIRLYPLLNEEVPANEKRTQDFFFSFPYQHTDTTVYHLPQGFEIDYKPAEKDIRHAFGSYSSRFTWNADTRTLTGIAQVEISKPMVKAADYQQLSTFARAIAADTNEKIVIKRL